MAAEILLTSEAFVKSVSSISDNVAGKYIKPSIREAQEIGLKGILGSALLAKLKQLVSAGTLDMPINAAYKELLDRSQYYLAYATIVEVAQKTSYKIGNFGVVKSSDENLQNATQDEIAKTQYYYQSKADACCYELQGWILENANAFPELGENHCRQIRSNLRSAASSGIFLGGARGKGPYYRRERR
jgi:hypothetical protein